MTVGRRKDALVLNPLGKVQTDTERCGFQASAGMHGLNCVHTLRCTPVDVNSRRKLILLRLDCFHAVGTRSPPQKTLNIFHARLHPDQVFEPEHTLPKTAREPVVSRSSQSAGHAAPDARSRRVLRARRRVDAEDFHQVACLGVQLPLTPQKLAPRPRCQEVLIQLRVEAFEKLCDSMALRQPEQTRLPQRVDPQWTKTRRSETANNESSPLRVREVMMVRRM